MNEPDYDDEPLPDPDSYQCGCGVVIKKGDAPHGEWYSTPDGYRLSCHGARALDDGRCDCQEEVAIYHVVVTSLAGEELARVDVCRTCAGEFDLSELCGGLPMPPPETQPEGEA